MGYKLADGSDSDLYEAGDAFIFDGLKCELIQLDGWIEPRLKFKDDRLPLSVNSIRWDCVYPTEETKRKVAERRKTPADAYREFDNQCKRILSKIFTAKDFPGLPVTAPPSLIDSLIALSLSIVDDYGAKTIVQAAIDALSAEPLARIIDWRGGEKVLNGDIVIDCGQTSVYRDIGMVSGADAVVVRINTAAIPKQRTMTREEVEREFGVKVVD